MDLAIQLRPDDAAARYIYGFTLATAGKGADAETHLRKAAELNAVYAAPHFVLATVFESQGKKPEAVAEYRAFLARASRNDLRREEAEKRLQTLSS